MSDNSYPEHERLARVSKYSQYIGEFLEWLDGGGSEIAGAPVILCVHDRTKDGWSGFNFAPLHAHRTRLLAEFFDIDLDLIDKEKRAMLAQIREEGNS